MKIGFNIADYSEIIVIIGGYGVISGGYCSFVRCCVSVLVFLAVVVPVVVCVVVFVVDIMGEKENKKSWKNFKKVVKNSWFVISLVI